jgi:hypothetical protein
MIVGLEYRKTKEEVNRMVDLLQDGDVTSKMLLAIDFAYHNMDNDYEDGLSFLDRLHRKLSIYYPIHWNIQNMKDMIRNSNNPSSTFVDVLNEILTDEMILCYGV